MPSDDTKSKQYRVKLESGRVLGPFGMAEVKKFVAKNKFTGSELAQIFPNGEWKSISAIEEIGSLFLRQLEGSKLTRTKMTPDQKNPAETVLLPGTAQAQSKRGLNLTQEEEGPSGALKKIRTLNFSKALNSVELEEKNREENKEITQPVEISSIDSDDFSDADKTLVAPRSPSKPSKTPELGLENEPSFNGGNEIVMQEDQSYRHNPTVAFRNVSKEETIVLQKPRGISNLQNNGEGSRRKSGLSGWKRILLVASIVALFGLELLTTDNDETMPGLSPIRVRLPKFSVGISHPEKSNQAYVEGLKYYVKDTVLDYLKAAKKFNTAASLDNSNLKAIALLASCYINLIDSSNKDEQYFSVVIKLIDLSRNKDLELPETIISEVEFFIAVGRPSAAEKRIVEFTKSFGKYDAEMYYYLAYAFYMRGEFTSAAKYISQFPEEKIFSPKIYYLKGQIAEKFESYDEAAKQYMRAIKSSPSHAKSRLRIAHIRSLQGRLSDAKDHLKYIVSKPILLEPKHQAYAHYLSGRLNEERQDYSRALGDIEKAVILDSYNSDYVLKKYSLLAKAGAQIEKVRPSARMYFYLGEGEKLVKNGNYQEALTQFLLARQANLKSALPLVKSGEMFERLNDLGNAAKNFEKASKLAPKSVTIWSKYAEVLIKSYDWEGTRKAIGKIQGLGGSRSTIDKLAGDVYSRQGQFYLALKTYKRAMSRKEIDQDIYLSYANALLEVGKCSEAPFFFSLAKRIDPLNMQAAIGTAKCIAKTEGVDRAIVALQDEQQNFGRANAEIISAIADLQIQNGEWVKAQININRAMELSPEYPYPHKLLAEYYFSKRGSDKNALEKALLAYQAYSDRNASDPSGYLERYRIFLGRGNFDQAQLELDKVYTIYPKYPLLHYYKGLIYANSGKIDLAIEEFKKELENHPNSVETLVELGRAFIKLGAYRDSLNQFSKAMAISEGAPEPTHMAGYANYLAKNYPGAVALFKTAIAKDSGNPILYKRLGITYLAMGDRISASKALLKYLQLAPDAPDRAQFERYL